MKVILGIDPGTNIMGYGIISVEGKTPSMITMGVLKLSQFESHYQRLGRIFERVSSIVRQYSPAELAIEAPFFGKNVQSMLKLGRAQGVAMAAAIQCGLPIFEYEPRKVKMAITGNGAASKEQVKAMVSRLLNLTPETITPQLDATDALGVALCHHYESSRPVKLQSGPKSWKEFAAKNPDKIKGF